MAAPNPSMAHDAVAERLATLDGIYRELLAATPAPDLSDEATDDEGTADEAA